MTIDPDLWSPLEHQVYRDLKAMHLQGASCLLAISGGEDSMAGLSIFLKLKAAFGFRLGIFHCHHGPGSFEQLQYRDQALEFVRSQALQKDLPFHFAKSSKELSGENEMREFRRQEAEKIRRQHAYQWVVWFHHQEDFLETQFLRLIRGGSPQAFFEPMSPIRNFDLRPFLRISKRDLQQALSQEKGVFLDDPSNKDESHLRNWLRRHWLPQLEEKCPGALKSLSRSLDLLRESLQESFVENLPEGIWKGEGISRPLFLTLSEAQKKQCLALYIRQRGQQEFNQNQIKEIIKQLDNPQSQHKLRAAHMVWVFTEDLIYAKAPFVVNAN